MSEAVSSPARSLIAVVDELLEFVNARYGGPSEHYFLSDDEQNCLAELDGRIGGLLTRVADGRIPFERSQSQSGHVRYTTFAGVPYMVTSKGVMLVRQMQWESRVQSLRAAVQVIINLEGTPVGGGGIRPGSDSPRDIERKPRKMPKRGPRNLNQFAKFKAAIDKAERERRSKTEAAADFTNGDLKRAKALLKQYYRNR